MEEAYESYAAAEEAVRGAAEGCEICERLLATLLITERRARDAEAEAATDALTGAGSRRHWERLLAAEEARCARYGHAACVVAVDLDGLKAVNDTGGHRAGDEQLRAAAAALGLASRATDIVARVGGDEFAVLAVDTDLRTGRVLVARLVAALADAGVPASVGLAERTAGSGLPGAWGEADRRMYAAKRRRRAAGGRPVQEMTPLDASASTTTPSTTR